MDLSPGTLLKDRYRIVQKLGEGGMGAVFLARDVSLENDVAVKANRDPSPESTNQFLREARLLAALRHPNLPRVIDYFILGQEQYLVMDYIPGKDLKTLLLEEGRQPLDKVLAWAKQLGSALTYMHNQTPPVIHRDIKPANIRLTATGEVVLVDFGIAKAADSSQATAIGASGYTAGYAPPEQYGSAYSSVRTGPFSDQYSLAATLYTMLTGGRPADAVKRVLNQETLLPVRALVPDVPEGVAQALERALTVKPEGRFDGVDAFVSSLVAGVSGPLPKPQVSPTDATVRGAMPTVRSSEAAPTQAAAVPAPKPFPWVWVAVGGGALAAMATLILVAALFLPKLLRGSATEAATPTLPPTAAPLPTDTVAAPPVEAPTGTPTPEPSATLEPTATDMPTETAVPPTPTFVPLGGSGEVVFSSDREDGQTLQLWSMKITLSDQGLVQSYDLAQLTNGPGDKTQAAWSPDGTQLLYVAPGGGDNGLDIWKMPADGSAEPVNLTQRKGDDFQPAWSPDGEFIVFTSDRREDGIIQLYMMGPEGEDIQRMSLLQEEYDATWSPDMQWMAFVLNASGNTLLFLRSQADEDAPSGATPVPPFYVTPQAFDRSTLLGTLGQVAQPAWSPDGSWIAYVRVDGARERIYIAKFPLTRPDQDVVKLTDNTTKDNSPSWSADSQWLAFMSNRDGNEEIYVMRSTGQTQTNLTNTEGRDLDPAWRP